MNKILLEFMRAKGVSSRRLRERMNMLHLKDVENWKSLNRANNFSLYDYIYHTLEQKEVKSDVFFAFLEVVWPSFIFFENFLFLKENFNKEKFKELSKQDCNIEYWMNFFTTDPYFEDFEQAKSFAKELKPIWEVKLKNEFPNEQFIVEYLHDDDVGDCGLTFYKQHSEGPDA